MADPKLVEILRQGSELWNQWREQQSDDVQIELSNADLHSIDLSGADLSYSNLREADMRETILYTADLDGSDLSHANLADAKLSYACLSHANLADANLTHAHLGGADLIYANLIGADLCDAYLGGANLDSADLSGADLNGADLCDAYLGGANLREACLQGVHLNDTTFQTTLLIKVDLSDVIGLETAQHHGPSIIDLDTIYLSYGQISEVFLRGCGVPETFIINMRSLVDSMSPIDYYTCFISYSHQNEDFARRLHADLQAQGVRCWFAEEDLKIGDHYHQRIDEAIRLYDKLILVLSDAAVQSAWVEREVVAAREKEDRQKREVLFPLRLDDAVMETNKAWAADVRRRWHIGDFTCWKDHDSYQQAFERLLRDLKAKTKGESNG